MSWLPSPSVLCLLLLMFPPNNGDIGKFKLGEIGVKGSKRLTVSYARRDRFSNEIFILRHSYYKIRLRKRDAATCPSVSLGLG